MELIAMESCQHRDLRSCSRLFWPYPLVLMRRFWWHFKTVGLPSTLSEAFALMRGRKAGNGTVKATCGATVRANEPLNLHCGEWVEVKSEEEILQTLDAAGANRGLVFIDEMRRYCGKQLRVHKRLERMLLEESKQVRRLKNTVLLDRAMCEGIGIGCDKSCFFFWREAWLRRAPEPQTETDWRSRAASPFPQGAPAVPQL
jgi:hypothetical protein